MALNVGVNVLEVDGRSSPAIQAAPTSVSGFLGITERGVPHRPVLVTDLDQFRAEFGGFRDDGYLAYAIQGFFSNGGRQAYISRVTGTGTAPATAALNDRQGAPAVSLRITAGQRGTADPGSWGNRITIDAADDPRLTTALQASTAAAATSADLVSVAGLRVGSVLRFVDGGSEFYRRLTAITGSTVTFAPAIAPALPVASTRVTSAEFRLTVKYRTSAISTPETMEEWRRLSMESDSPDYAITRVNHPVTGSRYITLADFTGTVASGLENPAAASGVALGGSTENAPAATDYSGQAALRTGFFAFDSVEIQLLAAPDAHRLAGGGPSAVARAAADYCASRNDCMYAGSAPDRGHPGTVARARREYNQIESAYLESIRSYSAPLQGNKVFGALYAPWIQVIDPIGPGPAPARFIPPDGHIMGLYARTEQERGIFKAPAGISALLRGALDVSAEFTDAEHTSMVREALVNGVRPAPGAGITVAASRTLSTDTRWWFVNVRLLFNFVKSSLREGLRFVRQEPHSDQLRRMVRLNTVTPFLLGLWRQGAFGSGKPEDTFSVKCDAENNPPDQVNLGFFKVEVYFYPVRPAESVVIVIGQQAAGSSAGEQ